MPDGSGNFRLRFEAFVIETSGSELGDTLIRASSQKSARPGCAVFS
jgi:hypothetical protein